MVVGVGGEVEVGEEGEVEAGVGREGREGKVQVQEGVDGRGVVYVSHCEPAGAASSRQPGGAEWVTGRVEVGSREWWD